MELPDFLSPELDNNDPANRSGTRGRVGKETDFARFTDPPGFEPEHEPLGKMIPTMFQPASEPRPLQVLFPVGARPTPAGSVLSPFHPDSLHEGLSRASATPAGLLLTWSMPCQSELERRHHEAGWPGPAEGPGSLVSSHVGGSKPRPRFGRQRAGADPIPAPCGPIGAPLLPHRRAAGLLPTQSKRLGRSERGRVLDDTLRWPLRPSTPIEAESRLWPSGPGRSRDPFVASSR